jgi:hypothetical protein
MVAAILFGPFSACWPGGAVTGAVPPATDLACRPDPIHEHVVPDFHIDAERGNDRNAGSSAAPWKTLAKGLALRGPAIVFVRDGKYGALTETAEAGRSAYLTLRAAPGAVPLLTGIKLSYPSSTSAFLRLMGFQIRPDHRNGGSIVQVSKGSDVELSNNSISAVKYAAATSTPGSPRAFDGINLNDAERIVIKSNCITSVSRGILASNSRDVTIKRNYITPQSGSAIQYLSRNSNFLIEDNHIRGQAYIPYPVDPDAFRDPHASIVSIRSGDITIRNNIMHGMGSTSGIRTYLPDATGGRLDYSDITIEGNLIYDIHHPHAVQITGLADRVLIRNNTVVSRYDVGSCVAGYPAGYPGLNDARSRYSTAFGVESIAPGKDGSGLTLANNIFIGTVFIPGKAIERNNIAWSFNSDGKYLAASPSKSTKIITSAYLGCSKHSRYFESMFFAGNVQFAGEHGRLLDFRPSKLSGVRNAGDKSLQAERILGSLDGNGWFVNEGGSRSAGEHSIGPYEVRDTH